VFRICAAERIVQQSCALPGNAWLQAGAALSRARTDPCVVPYLNGRFLAMFDDVLG
jgi:hypothetical protein